MAEMVPSTFVFASSLGTHVAAERNSLGHTFGTSPRATACATGQSKGRAAVLPAAALVAVCTARGQGRRRRLLRAWLRKSTMRGVRTRLRSSAERAGDDAVAMEESAAACAEEVQPESLLVEAWESALEGSTGDIFTEPATLRKLTEPFISAPGDEVVGSLRFERLSKSGDDGDLVLYVPGIDFTGIFAAAQFRGLARQGCELWRCYVPTEDRTPFIKLAKSLEQWLASRVAAGRRVVVVAESFGGLLAIKVALKMGKALSGLVLVNPATSYDRTVWPLAGRVLSALPPTEPSSSSAKAGLSTQDFLEDMWDRARQSPYAYLGSTFVTGTVAHSAQIRRIASKVALGVIDANANGSDSVEFMQDFLTFPEELEKILPPETVRFRLRSWLRDGNEDVNSELRLKSTRNVELPPMLLVSGEDSFLPSRSECRRLAKLFEVQCPKDGLKLVELEDCGHAPLDDRVDLASLMRDSPIWEKPPKAKNYVDDWAPPTAEELEEGSESVEGIAQFLSPVFLSTDAETGERRFGLDGLPDHPLPGNRPLLFVGNHQQLALELGPFVREVLIEKGYVPRGLAHPINFPEGRKELFDSSKRSNGEEVAETAPEVADFLGLPFELRAAAKALMEEDGEDEEEKDDPDDPGLAMQDFTKWGAVPVTPKNFFRMLQRGDPILLYPGGPAEALAAPEDKYKLFWPMKTDFVRAAARFNAVVVPFGNIGSADNFQGWGDLEPAREYFPPPFGTRGWPDQGEGPKLNSDGLMPVSEALETPLDFPALLPASQLASEKSPGVGDRIYVSFGKPVDLQGLDPRNKEACQEKYKELRTAVEAEINFLLEAREKDPYRDVVRRQVYERLASAGATPRVIRKGSLQGAVVKSYGVRAPSFPIPSGEDEIAEGV